MKALLKVLTVVLVAIMALGQSANAQRPRGNQPARTMQDSRSHRNNDGGRRGYDRYNYGRSYNYGYQYDYGRYDCGSAAYGLIRVCLGYSPYNYRDYDPYVNYNQRGYVEPEVQTESQQSQETNVATFTGVTSDSVKVSITCSDPDTKKFNRCVAETLKNLKSMKTTPKP